MSTHAVIARPTATGFEGRYVHWDGYPTGVGIELINLRATKFGGDTAAMLRFLIDEHPAGWSGIVDVDWSLEPGFVDVGEYTRPQCYCHGARGQSERMITEETNWSIEWAYVLRGGTMVVMQPEGGVIDRRWFPRYVVNLDDLSTTEIGREAAAKFALPAGVDTAA